MSDFPDIAPPQPFWFVDSELLADVLHVEIRVVNQMSTNGHALRSLFDIPEPTMSQRKLCFTVLAHRKILEVIHDKFTALYEPPPALSEEESKTLESINGLVTDDAPSWVLEIDRVVEQLPSHIFSSLPEPLQAGGFVYHDPEKSEAIQSAARTFGTVEQIQNLIKRMLNQQLKRLTRRWTVPPVESRHSKKRKFQRTRDRARVSRDREIAEIDDVSPTTTEYLQLMDERNVKPQPTWSPWPGSWKAAYRQPHLRKLIHQDKSRALSRARGKK